MAGWTGVQGLTSLFYVQQFLCAVAAYGALRARASFNAQSWGFECVGDFDREKFECPVRVKYVEGLACLYIAAGCQLAPFERGVRGCTSFATIPRPARPARARASTRRRRSSWCDQDSKSDRRRSPGRTYEVVRDPGRLCCGSVCRRAVMIILTNFATLAAIVWVALRTVRQQHALVTRRFCRQGHHHRSMDRRCPPCGWSRWLG